MRHVLLHAFSRNLTQLYLECHIVFEGSNFPIYFPPSSRACSQRAVVPAAARLRFMLGWARRRARATLECSHIHRPSSPQPFPGSLPSRLLLPSRMACPPPTVSLIVRFLDPEQHRSLAARGTMGANCRRGTSCPCSFESGGAKHCLVCVFRNP